MDNVYTDEVAEQKKLMGERMKARRELLGMKQQEVADHLDINRVTYTQYEIGENQIPSTKLPTLAKFFGVPVAYFFGEVEAEEIEQDEFIQFYNGRPPDQQEQARRVLKALFATQDEIGRQLSREDTTHGKKAE